jgi:hypothetical protein
MRESTIADDVAPVMTILNIAHGMLRAKARQEPRLAQAPDQERRGGRLRRYPLDRPPRDDSRRTQSRYCAATR